MKYNPFSLENKTILVTGASSGIGKTSAIEISKMGASVIINGRDIERLENTLNSLEGAHNQIIASDISSDEGLERLVFECPNIDGIVHSAGIADPKPFSFVNRNYIDNLLSINLYAPLLLTQKFYKLKKLKQNASIVFVSSVSGNLVTSIGNSIYSASKSAINGSVKGLALEFAKKKIRVNTIMPGMIQTDIFNNSSISQANLKEDIRNYPLGGYGKTEDVAFAAIYLLSDASGWVTGTNLLIDGGFTLI